MSGWEIFTWFSAIALAVSGVVIFGFFLRDARGILQRNVHQSDDDSAPEDDEPSAGP